MRAKIIKDQMSEITGNPSRVGQIVEVKARVKLNSNIWIGNSLDWHFQKVNKDVTLVNCESTRIVNTKNAEVPTARFKAWIDRVWYYGNDIFSDAELEFIED